jgi:hypothetical protein
MNDNCDLGIQLVIKDVTHYALCLVPKHLNFINMFALHINTSTKLSLLCPIQ